MTSWQILHVVYPFQFQKIKGHNGMYSCHSCNIKGVVVMASSKQNMAITSPLPTTIFSTSLLTKSMHATAITTYPRYGAQVLVSILHKSNVQPPLLLSSICINHLPPYLTYALNPLQSHDSLQPHPHCYAHWYHELCPTIHFLSVQPWQSGKISISQMSGSVSTQHAKLQLQEALG